MASYTGSIDPSPETGVHRCPRNPFAWDGHRLAEHSGEGSLAQCADCGRWRRCWGHYPTHGCLTYAIYWWDRARRRAIRRYLAEKADDEAQGRPERHAEPVALADWKELHDG